MSIFEGLQLGSYGVILADPPWRFKTYSAKGRGRCPDAPLPRALQRQNRPERHYATMTLKDIAALPVGDLAARDSLLLLWVPDPFLELSFGIAQGWGFTYKTVGFYWPKMRREGSRRHLLHDEPDHKLFPMGTGYWTRANPEQCLLFTRGCPKRRATDVRKLVFAPRREHSRKPDEIYSRIERLAHGPYCELFSRTSRLGWDSWGDETGKFPEAA